MGLDFQGQYEGCASRILSEQVLQSQLAAVALREKALGMDEPMVERLILALADELDTQPVGFDVVRWIVEYDWS